MRKFSAEVRMPGGAEATTDRLTEILEGLAAAPATVHDERSVSVRTRTGLWSWGERVTCTVVPTGDGFLIRVESRSAVPTTLIDFGVNRRNVERVVRALQASTG